MYSLYTEDWKEHVYSYKWILMGYCALVPGVITHNNGRVDGGLNLICVILGKCGNVPSLKIKLSGHLEIYLPAGNI